MGVGATANITIQHVDNDYVLYTFSAGDLPAVKDTDNGKYMLVDGGAWKAKVPPTATPTSNGPMSAADKEKLDGVATGANKTVVDAAMSDTSTNPVQAKVVKAYIDGKVAAAGSNITVDAALDAESTNPVQNKAVKSALDEKMDKSGGTLTGNLTGQYFIGTWLQTTAASDLGRTPGKIAVLDDAGWVYYRTPAELLADIGAATVSTIMDKVYPVGAIYISANSTNPKTLFGVGTWTQIKDTFLLAAGSTYKAGTTGGEAEHTLTAEELPTHQHPIWAPNASGEANAAIGLPQTGSKNTYYAEASKTGGAGGGKAHNNMPPYLAVYVWRRTA